ncbi:hypothetical protein DC498_08150 [Terrimonas sp.]|uniref:hypothetical protein n=1 Tax=Terrimonas sp. TaxID=1914338 RepID=UPI000D51E9C7|nr:hypothetical protein [Terrimonas sp.]PVD52883.1 hypothetical protein DC498_08150 [Terrimonas sp.]
MHFYYDPSGEKVAKIILYNPTTTSAYDFYYWYVRDAQGNLMATYKTTGSNINSTPLILAEHYMYACLPVGRAAAVWGR